MRSASPSPGPCSSADARDASRASSLRPVEFLGQSRIAASRIAPEPRWICFSAIGFGCKPRLGSASDSPQTVLGSHMIIWVGVKIASTRRSQAWVGMAGMISSSFSSTQTGALDEA